MISEYTMQEKLTKHQIIKNYILELIQTKKYRAHDRLPSRSAMSKLFSCAPATIVKVFDELTTEGLVYKINGSGTYIAEQAKKSRISIAILLSSIDYYDDSLFGAYNFKPQILQYIESAASNVNADVSLHLDFNDSKLQRQKLESIISNKYDGLIYLDEINSKNLSLFQEVKRNGTTIIQIDRINFPDLSDSVVSDNQMAVSETINILYDKGFSNIYFLTYPHEFSSILERKNAYIKACHNLGIIPRIYTISADTNRVPSKSSISIIHNIINSIKEGTAIFSTDAYQLNSVYDIMMTLIKPEFDLSKIALASFDGMPTNLSNNINTITIIQDIKSICNESVKIIHDKSQKDKNYISNVKIPCKIVTNFKTKNI